MNSFIDVFNMLVDQGFEDTTGVVDKEAFRGIVALEVLRQMQPERNLPDAEELTDMVSRAMIEALEFNLPLSAEAVHDTLRTRHRRIDFDYTAVEFYFNTLTKMAKDKE